jgi:hypothetical protein
MGRSNIRTGHVDKPEPGGDGSGRSRATPGGSGPVGPAKDWDSSEPGTFNFKTSFVVGIFFGVFALLLTMMAGSASLVGGDMNGSRGARFGLVLGLLFGVGVIGMILKVLRTRIELRSTTMYRGLWFALIGAAVAIGFMALTPSLNYPADCPPGQLCTTVNN